jgi:predicted kinase
MRLKEIFTDEEWQRLEQLIYATTWKALSTYQQQQATQQRIAIKPAATLQPKSAKKAKTLARKAKRAPYAAPPKPLPTPNKVPQAKAEATPAYRPVKTVKQLPPTTRVAMAKAQPRTIQPIPNKPAPQSITDPKHIDQAARRILPPDKLGPSPIDLVTP